MFIYLPPELKHMILMKCDYDTIIKMIRVDQSWDVLLDKEMEEKRKDINGWIFIRYIIIEKEFSQCFYHIEVNTYETYNDVLKRFDKNYSKNYSKNKVKIIVSKLQIEDLSNDEYIFCEVEPYNFKKKSKVKMTKKDGYYWLDLKENNIKNVTKLEEIYQEKQRL